MPVELMIPFGGLSVLAKTERCPQCELHIGRDRAEFFCNHMPVRNFPLCLTSDGFFVATKKFHDFVYEHGFTGMSFVPLVNHRYVMKVSRKLEYELDRLEYLNRRRFCDLCQCYESNLVFGPRPIAPSEKPIGPLEFAESRVLWGEEAGPETAKQPDLIVGDEGARILKQGRFGGITFTETI